MSRHSSGARFASARTTRAGTAVTRCRIEAQEAVRASLRATGASRRKEQSPAAPSRRSYHAAAPVSAPPWMPDRSGGIASARVRLSCLPCRCQRRFGTRNIDWGGNCQCPSRWTSCAMTGIVASAVLSPPTPVQRHECGGERSPARGPRSRTQPPRPCRRSRCRRSAAGCR